MHCDKRSPKSVYIRGKNISTRYELYVGVIGYQGPAESLISKSSSYLPTLRKEFKENERKRKRGRKNWRKNKRKKGKKHYNNRFMNNSHEDYMSEFIEKVAITPIFSILTELSIFFLIHS
ncbi:uncharacterized protein OCT59_009452 [Rhizophagus irregularis]|uniref:uncharacterized protein n=1 Tax=Rhizophagus irregularis TaxID=588596 RepID=UPI003329F237|nr:hypothetical protein OCT59_009452 [Rhizophagus irregularis]